MNVVLRTLAVCLLLCLALQGAAVAHEVDFTILQTGERASSPTIKVRFVHALANAPALRLLIDHVTVVPSLKPRDRTGYIELAIHPGQEYNFTIWALYESGEVRVRDGGIDFDNAVASTAIITGDMDLNSIVYIDDAPYDSANSSFITSVNGHSEYETGFDVIDKATGNALFPSGPFASEHAGSILSGTYDLEVRPAGLSEVLLTLNAITFEPGQRYLFDLHGPLLDLDSLSAARVKNDRFRVTAEWRSFDGTTGAGQVYGTSAESAEFWFFSPSNIELIAKVIDGEQVNHHFWVFTAALTNIQFDLTVFDTQARIARQYHNEEAAFASFGDIEAFPAP